MIYMFVYNKQSNVALHMLCNICCVTSKPRIYNPEIFIRAHSNVSEVDLSQDIFLFTVHQSRALIMSDMHCKLKSMKILSDLSLDKPSFLVLAYMKQHTFCIQSLWKLELERTARKAQASPQLVNFQWLAWMATPRAVQLRP